MCILYAAGELQLPHRGIINFILLLAPKKRLHYNIFISSENDKQFYQHDCNFFNHRWHRQSGYLLQDEIKHEDEAAEVHVVILTVQVESAVARGVAKVFKGAAAQGAAERAPEGAGERAEGVVLAPATWIWHHAHLQIKRFPTAS